MVIHGNEVEVKLGSCVRPDGWRFGQRLIASAWDVARFRLPTGSAGPVESLAVNVVATGRTWQRREGGYWVRVRVEFVGDGEPSVFAGGWMLRG